MHTHCEAVSRAAVVISFTVALCRTWGYCRIHPGPYLNGNSWICFPVLDWLWDIIVCFHWEFVPLFKFLSFWVVMNLSCSNRYERAVMKLCVIPPLLNELNAIGLFFIWKSQLCQTGVNAFEYVGYAVIWISTKLSESLLWMSFWNTSFLSDWVRNRRSDIDHSWQSYCSVLSGVLWLLILLQPWVRRTLKMTESEIWGGWAFTVSRFLRSG